MKKAGPLVAGAAVAFATVIAVAPTANAEAERVTQDREVTFTCTGNGAGDSAVTPSTFTVTYPVEVAPGETFTVSVQPGEMRNNSGENGRMTLDYRLPTNAAILGLNVAGGAKGLTGAAPTAIRVNDSKNADSNGSVVRVWGGASARFGDNSSTSNINGGIHVPANTEFQLPQLDIAMRAPAQVGADMAIGFPGVSEAHTSNGSALSTDLQWVSSRNRPAQCSADTSSDAALTTTTVGDLAPVILPSSTTLDGGDRTLGPDQGTTFSANVTTEYGAVSQLPQGQVEFWDTVNNVSLGAATPNAAGLAELDYTFASVAGGQPDQVVKVEARYVGVDGDIAASTSAQVSVTNTSKPTVFNEVKLNLRASLGTPTDNDVPVTITAAIVRPAGTPQDVAMVQLFRGDTPVGEPVALPAANEMTFTDTIAREQRTRTEKYRVEFVEPVIVGYVQWDAVTQPVSVIVNGTNPSLDPPLTGGDDSGSLSMFGSLGNMFGS